jgi:hypothetical protein
VTTQASTSSTHSSTGGSLYGVEMHPAVRKSSFLLKTNNDGTWTIDYNGTTLRGLNDFEARACIDIIYRTGQLPQPTGELFDPEVLRDALEGRR